MSMQQEKGGLEEELKRTKEKLSVSEVEKYRAFDQLRGAKKEAREANMKANESLMMEIENLKEMLSTSRDELKIKDKKIDSLESELQKTRESEVALAEKDKELRDLREKERATTVLLSENKKRIQELEDEIAGGKKSSDNDSEKEIRGLKLDLQMVRESEMKALLEAKTIYEEMELVKNESKLAMEAEEKSAKAMEDLALALKEVATESNLVKEKLGSTQIELEELKGEAEQLKAMVRSTEERYQKLLTEAKQEGELYRNTADRLRVEAEETLLAWNGKEMGFVSCIRRAEEDKAYAQHESNKLSEALKGAENLTRAAREETYKLRDILKQAINEANAAKAAAGIARDENSLLKDCLTEKEEAAHFLAHENERLRINEAALQENVKELKRLLSTVSIEFETEDKAIRTSLDEENEKNKIQKNFSFDLEDLKFMTVLDEEKDKVLDEDPDKAEALKGSIFDANAETPTSEPHTPKSISSNQRGYTSPFTDDGGTPNSEEFDHLDSSNGDSDTERNSHRRMKTMFRRVGDILMIRRSVHKKEPSVE
ncbi:hypothetical protein BUALT_Bualt11G0020600 [Buddleja alternifolia]|uniref:Myosin heavy chain n=1 Tax=Buddleja alternifolia TaxID=168488 RepID=A0AAV6WYW3_9LAMI|nr:hypothetical protein BUALT_Bualt11G0020600 [Buddleja alternifolia]